MKQERERESAFELIRIVAQVMIVFYHILYFAIFPIAEEPFYRAFYFPLHIGVPLFILISGYFGIKPSVKGFINLLGMVFLLSIPLIVRGVVNGDLQEVAGGILFVSRTPYWFIRCYIFLYLSSIVINRYLKDLNTTGRILLILVLFYISDICGTIGSDKTLREGYNIFTFLMFYCVGNTLKVYRDVWAKWSEALLVVTWVVFNAIVVAIFTKLGFDHPIVEKIYERGFYEYCSVFMLLNSVWFFFIMAKLKIHSKIINVIARASLAIYMIHGFFLFEVINPIATRLYEMNSHPAVVLVSILGLSLIVVLACVAIYLVLTPLWNAVRRLGERVQDSLDKRSCLS